eukprot:TRINITY_DN5056_c0_g1_i6.p1 TRINITY_DN5056_c0_g1~~TRINITY_DN5056_c0_g1_i6.p1  ORF type:complete len:295 (+),score=58.81 TRINITY_DN5056_c0_g1_i6:75-959(+)
MRRFNHTLIIRSFVKIAPQEEEEDEDEDTDMEYDIVYWVHGVIFLCLFNVAALQLYRIANNVGSLMSEDAVSQKVFHGLLLLCFLIRAIFFALVPSDENGDIAVPEFILFIMNLLPAFLYYSAYTILILYWAEIYYNTIQSFSAEYDISRMSVNSKDGSCFGFANLAETRFKSTTIFMRVNAVVYIPFFILCIIFAAAEDLQDLVWNIGLTFSASICLLTAVGFLVYGNRQYEMLGQLPVKSGFRSTQLHKVLWVTIICTTCFSVRALIIIWSALIDPLNTNWALIFGKRPLWL